MNRISQDHTNAVISEGGLDARKNSEENNSMRGRFNNMPRGEFSETCPTEFYQF